MGQNSLAAVVPSYTFPARPPPADRDVNTISLNLPIGDETFASPEKPFSISSPLVRKKAVQPPAITVTDFEASSPVILGLTLSVTSSAALIHKVEKAEKAEEDDGLCDVLKALSINGPDKCVGEDRDGDAYEFDRESEQTIQPGKILTKHSAL